MLQSIITKALFQVLHTEEGVSSGRSKADSVKHFIQKYVPLI